MANLNSMNGSYNVGYVIARHYDTYKTIHEAVEFGCYSNVKKHLHGDANVDEEDGAGATPLHYAVMHGFETIATLLLNGGANPSTGIPYWSPLHSACENGYLSLASDLIQRGANLEARDKHGQTPIFYADETLTKLMIEEGAQTDTKNTEEWTPLLSAIVFGRQKNIAKILIYNGAKVDLTMRYGFRPLYFAVKDGNNEMVLILIEKGVKLGLPHKDIWTVLHEACYDGLFLTVKLLLDHGADSNSERVVGSRWTPLRVATLKGQGKVASLLESRGARRRN
jgi:ankyrin repeat protein